MVSSPRARRDRWPVMTLKRNRGRSSSAGSRISGFLVSMWPWSVRQEQEKALSRAIYLSSAGMSSDSTRRGATALSPRPVSFGGLAPGHRHATSANRSRMQKARSGSLLALSYTTLLIVWLYGKPSAPPSTVPSPKADGLSTSMSSRLRRIEGSWDSALRSSRSLLRRETKRSPWLLATRLLLGFLLARVARRHGWPCGEPWTKTWSTRWRTSWAATS